MPDRKPIDRCTPGLRLTSASISSTRRELLAATAAGCLALGHAPRAWAAGELAGKTMTLIVGFPPGGGVDTGARVIAKHLPRFIDGAPNIIVQNMPGAGGVTAASHLFTKAARDGLTLGVPGRDWPLAPILLDQGARFDPLAFEYIGSTGEVNTFVWVRKSLGINTPEDLKRSKKRVVFGGLTPSTQPSMVPKILSLDGFPTAAVSGYRGTADIINAIETGEVEAIATNEASFARRPDMIANMARVFQLLSSPQAVPLAGDHLSEESRHLLTLTGYASATGMPLVMPPDSQATIVAIIREAFTRMVDDKEFQADADKIGEPYGTPIGGARIREILRQTIQSATPAVIAKFRELASK